jgi:hypothetical protein
MGNIVNRVFDSSGPEGKVRGTPQQIIDKYTQLARDATLSNDRVAAENFQQHAEHYTRMLGEALREQEARREQQEQQQQQHQQQNNRDRDRNRDQQRPNHSQNTAGGAPESDTSDNAPNGDLQNAPQPDTFEPKLEAPATGDVIDLDGGAAAGSGLVETPETTPKPKRPPRQRKPRVPKADKPAKSDDSAPVVEQSTDAPPEAAE